MKSALMNMNRICKGPGISLNAGVVLCLSERQQRMSSSIAHIVRWTVILVL